MENINKPNNNSVIRQMNAFLSISIGTSIAIGMGSGIALGIAYDNLIIGIAMGSLFSVLVGLAVIRKNKKK